MYRLSCFRDGEYTPSRKPKVLKQKHLQYEYQQGKARGRWMDISRVLIHEGAVKRVSGMFYKVVVQSVLLCASETWVVVNTKYYVQ
jgi:hypothetical protein